MSANNCAMLIGRAGRDPEVRYTGQGTAVAKFSLAVNRPIKDKSGNSVTDWFEVELWGKQGELAGELVRKGSLVSVAGAVQIDEWENRDGVKQRTVKLKADSFQLLESKKDSDQAQPAERRQAAQPQQTAAFDEDEIPPF